MNILITGGFGNIGISVIDECLKRGHAVSVFDIENRRTKKLSQLYKKKTVRTIFGDIRNFENVFEAVLNQDAIIHLAAILPPLSDKNPELCKAVNIDGTKNILEAINKNNNKAAMVEVSSASVMGPTQNMQPPINTNNSVNATDTYSHTKIEAEKLIVESKIKYCILRLAAVLPTKINMGYFLNMVQNMFEMPLLARCEIVLDIDVASALVSAAEILIKDGELSGKKGFIAGGARNGCQLTNKEMLTEVFSQIGLKFPREVLFSDNINNYYLDWYDTEDMQKLLNFQNHSFMQWKTIINNKLKKYLLIIIVFQYPILKWLEKKSIRYK